MADVAAGREVGTFVAGRNPVGMAVSSDGLTGFVAAFDEDAVLVGGLPGWGGWSNRASELHPAGGAAQRSFLLYLPLVLRGAR